MAFTMKKPERQQQLGELLQQQQEPFVLENYLIERGYLIKSLSKRLESSRFGCCNGNSNKLFSTKGIPSCSKILRAILKKFGHSKEAKFDVNETQRNDQEAVKQERFSSASSTAVFNSICSESEKDEKPSNKHFESAIADTLEGLRLSNMTDDEAFADREFEFQFMENNKQHSPVSVLEPFPLSSKFSFPKRQEQENQTICTVSLPSNLVREHSTTSVSMSQLHLQFISEKPKTIGSRDMMDYEPMKLIRSDKNSSPQFAKSKRIILQETRQLLFDCVREIVEMESHAIGDEKVKKCNKGLKGSEELGNRLLERMKAWDQQVGNEPKTLTSSLNLDFFDSTRKWSDFELEKREICAEIGNAILEEMMSEINVEAMNI